MTPPAQIAFREVRSVADVINATFSFVRRNALLLGKSMLYIGGPVVAFVSLSLAAFTLLPLVAGPGSTAALAAVGVLWMPMMIGYLIMALLPMLIVFGFIRLYHHRGPDGFEVHDVWRLVKRDFWRMLGSLALGVLVMIAAYVVLLIPSAILGGLLAALTPLAIVPIILAFLVGMLFLGVLVLMSFPARAFERIGAGQALGRARTLLEREWWPTTGLVVMLLLIQFALTFSLQAPTMALSFLIGQHTIEGGEGTAVIGLLFLVFNLLSSAAGLLLSGLLYLGVAFHYFSLVEEKERHGLLQRVRAFAEAHAPPAPSPSEAPDAGGPMVPPPAPAPAPSEGALAPGGSPEGGAAPRPDAGAPDA